MIAAKDLLGLPPPLKVLIQVAFDSIDDFLSSTLAHANIEKHPGALSTRRLRLVEDLQG